jgi:hypothetical protein
MAERAKGKRSKKGGNGIGHNSDSVGGNVPDEVYRRWLSKIEHAEAIHDRAHDAAKSRKGELRQIYEAAKEDGCNIDAIKEARKNHKLDHCRHRPRAAHHEVAARHPAAAVRAGRLVARNARGA